MTAAVAYRSNAAPAPRRATVPQPTARRSPSRDRSARRGLNQHVTPQRVPGRQAAARPQLRVLDQAAVRRRARRRNALILLFLTLLSALFVVAFVHAHLVATQQDLDQTRADIADLRNERSRLERAVDQASSPALIVERAGELGLVRAAQPVFLVSVEPTGGSSPTVVEAAATSPFDPAALVSQPDGDPTADSGSETALGGSGDG